MNNGKKNFFLRRLQKKLSFFLPIAAKPKSTFSNLWQNFSVFFFLKDLFWTEAHHSVSRPEKCENEKKKLN